MNKKYIKNDIIIVNILKFRKYAIIYEEEKMKSKFYIKALLIILLAVSLITIPNIYSEESALLFRQSLPSNITSFIIALLVLFFE